MNIYLLSDPRFSGLVQKIETLKVSINGQANSVHVTDMETPLDTTYQVENQKKLEAS